MSEKHGSYKKSVYVKIEGIRTVFTRSRQCKHILTQQKVMARAMPGKPSSIIYLFIFTNNSTLFVYGVGRTVCLQMQKKTHTETFGSILLEVEV